MSKNQEDRRYTDQEFALILRKVSELQRDRPGPHGGDDGLTLLEMQQIAAEAGMDPELVARAVDLLPSRRLSTAAKIFGGSDKYRAVRTVPGVVPNDELGRLVETIREVLDCQGEAKQVFGGLEWKTGTEPSRVSVNVSSRDDGTRLEVSVDRGGTAFLTYFGPSMGFLLVSAALVGGLGVDSLQGALAVVLPCLGAAFATGRTLFSRGTRKWNDTVPKLMDALEATAKKVAGEKPAGGEPSSLGEGDP
ncbi:hypothetical protein ACFL3S_10420 [Gemmatimonadota bacterium]